MENPVTRVRTNLHLSKKAFAEKCGVHVSVIYLLEQGCYPRILPEVRRTLIATALEGTSRCSLLTRSENHFIDNEYHGFQLGKRLNSGMKYGMSLYDLSLLGPPGLDPPVVAFRAHIGIALGAPNGLSRLMFAKEFCIHPAELYSLEKGSKHVLSEQFRQAMLQAGLRDTVLSELEFRCQEYAGGERISNGSNGSVNGSNAELQ